MFTFLRRIRRSLLSDNKYRKYLSYAIGEIILVVFGILIALQVNNCNNERIDQENIKGFAKSLIKDIEGDIIEINTRQNQVNKINRRIDSLIYVVNSRKTYDDLNIDLLCLSWNLYYMPHKWNRSSLDQMKNSAALKHIKSDSLLKTIGKYDALTIHLDEDYKGDQSRIEMIEPYIHKIVNYNYSNIRTIRKDLFFVISIPENDDFQFFNHKDYLKAKEENLQVLSRNKSDYDQLISKLVSLQFQYGVRNYELDRLKVKAELLIQMLKKEYSIGNPLETKLDNLQTDSTEVKKIKTALIDMWDAIEKEDIERYASYIHPDFTQFGETDSVLRIGKSAEIEGINSWVENSSDIHTEMLEPRITVKGNTAWIVYYWSDRGISEGKTFTSRGKSTRIFVKEDGKWLCIHGHYTLLS